MRSMMVCYFVGLLSHPVLAQSIPAEDKILGKWIADEKILTIEVYKRSEEYRARIISFRDHHNKIPSDQRLDERNPDPQKRNRRMIGMDVLTGLNFDSSEMKWADGKIYDAASGKSYSALLVIDDRGKLLVRAYKGISILGKTLSFHR